MCPELRWIDYPAPRSPANSFVMAGPIRHGLLRAWTEELITGVEDEGEIRTEEMITCVEDEGQIRTEEMIIGVEDEGEIRTGDDHMCRGRGRD